MDERFIHHIAERITRTLGPSSPVQSLEDFYDSSEELNVILTDSDNIIDDIHEFHDVKPTQRMK